MRFFFRAAVLSGLALFSPTLAQLSSAPYDASQVTLVGSITDMQLDPTNSNPLRGGTISVDGVLVIIPENTIATLPAAAVAWPELFDSSNSPKLPGTQTWKASVFANRVNDNLIAGLVYIAQDPSRSLQGFITNIDYDTGIFTVHGTFNPGGMGGMKCVINDPLGVYGLPYTGSNSLWSVDPVNPSIHTVTGFPMCIPRNAVDDPLCPKKNRPIDPTTGRESTQYTFGDPSTLNEASPDPLIMAPLIVGDYITYSGQLIGDIFEVNDLAANIGYYTAPGTKPVYVTCDESQWGITLPAIGERAETRAVVFTTDPSTTVQWFAEDVDPCSGKISERAIQLVVPQQNAPLGRVVYRMGSTAVNSATRNVGFRSSSGTIQTKNNLTAGEFHQPMMDFIFPEITTFGVNAEELSFDTFPFLAQGSGPYVPGDVLADPLNDTEPAIIGQLNPWPGKIVPPPPSSCIISLTSATSSGTYSPTPPPSVDSITIISAAKAANRGGSNTVTIIAQSDNSNANLLLAVGGSKTPIPASPMTKNADGTWSLSVLTKGVPTDITVTSDLGGSASQAI